MTFIVHELNKGCQPGKAGLLWAEQEVYPHAQRGLWLSADYTFLPTACHNMYVSCRLIEIPFFYLQEEKEKPPRLWIVQWGWLLSSESEQTQQDKPSLVVRISEKLSISLISAWFHVVCRQSSVKNFLDLLAWRDFWEGTGIYQALNPLTTLTLGWLLLLFMVSNVPSSLPPSSLSNIFLCLV